MLLINNEEIERIEAVFKNRCINVHGVKCETKKFYELQCEYFIGVQVALNIALPKWTICIGSGRPIITYKL